MKCNLKDKVDVYGATWCSDTRETIDFMVKNVIDFEWHDTDAKGEAGKKNSDLVLEMNEKTSGNRERRIPVVVIRKNEKTLVLIEPSNDDLEKLLI